MVFLVSVSFQISNIYYKNSIQFILTNTLRPQEENTINDGGIKSSKGVACGFHTTPLLSPQEKCSPTENEGSMWVSRCLIINTKGGYKGNEYSETRAACGDHAAPL